MIPFQNDVPIEDDLVVLDLLVSRWNDGTRREIVRLPKGTPPYVEIAHLHEHSDPTIVKYLVTDDVTDRLLALGQIEGKPDWGYRSKFQLLVSESGTARLWRERERWGITFGIRAEHWYRRHHG